MICTRRYTFTTGYRVVTVRAKTFDDAVERARRELDRRCEKVKTEPPVGWSLALIRMQP